MTGKASPKKKGLLTVPEAQRLLKERHGIDAKLTQVRYFVDKLGLADRFGNYRVLPESALPKLAKAISAKT